MFGDSGRRVATAYDVLCAVAGAADPAAATVAAFRKFLRSITDSIREMRLSYRCKQHCWCTLYPQTKTKLRDSDSMSYLVGGLHLVSSTDDKRGDRGQIQVTAFGDIGREYRSRDGGRRQISARRPCSIHDKVHVLAHQSHVEFRRVVVILYLPKLPDQRRRHNRCFGKNFQQNVSIDLKMFPQ